MNPQLHFNNQQQISDLIMNNNTKRIKTEPLDINDEEHDYSQSEQYHEKKQQKHFNTSSDQPLAYQNKNFSSKKNIL